MSVFITRLSKLIQITEVQKVVNNICPPIMKTFFDFTENRYNSEIPRKKTAKNKNCPI